MIVFERVLLASSEWSLNPRELSAAIVSRHQNAAVLLYTTTVSTNCVGYDHFMAL